MRLPPIPFQEIAMKTIHVTASTEYDVIVGQGLLDTAADRIRSATKADTLCIVSDHTVWAIYGKHLKDALINAGYRCVNFCFPAGENTKSPENYISLLEFLAENRVGRNDCIIALGGGVIGDLAGFAAATYLRGVDLIQIPTTVLAMVDASVGGKTAINLSAGKNLAGAFHQPKLVLCDTNLLNTLPKATFHDGCAEIIKYAMLYDPVLMEHLQLHGLDFDRDRVIARCVELKRDAVTADEFDRGQRQKLNFGHTFGHAIEAASNYRVTHGKAVAMGMAMICRASGKMSLCPQGCVDTLTTILQQFGLEDSTALGEDVIIASVLSDKKRTGDVINLIVPRAIGNCEIMTVCTEALTDWIRLGM